LLNGYSAWDVDFHMIVDDAFQQACSCGHISIAQWLYRLDDIDIHSRDDLTFRLACCCDLSVAQWLYGLVEVNIPANEDHTF
jgi:hypothetical protein